MPSFASRALTLFGICMVTLTYFWLVKPTGFQEGEIMENPAILTGSANVNALHVKPFLPPNKKVTIKLVAPENGIEGGIIANKTSSQGHQSSDQLSHSIEYEFKAVEKIMKERIRIMNEYCRSNKQNDNRPINAVLRFNNTNLCRVPKCGSTFWASAILALSKKVKYNELNRLDRQRIHMELSPSITFGGYKQKPGDILVLFTRNPWKRLYSAYIDKIYRLQGDFISIIRGILHKNKNDYCGEVPSFQQFLDSIISSGDKRTLNLHWRPIEDLCQACAYNYSYMIQQETFTQDSMYLLHHLLPVESPVKEAIVALMKEDFSRDSVGQLARQFIHEGRQMKYNCTNLLDVIKRLWTSLQIQGLISNKTVFDKNAFSDISKMNDNELENLFISASVNNPLTKAERSAQKQKFYQDAYSNITHETLDKIKEIYKYDFHLFGYNMNYPIK